MSGTYDSTVKSYLADYVGEIDEALTHLTASADRTAQAVQDAAQEREMLRARARTLQDDLMSAQANLRDASARHSRHSQAAQKIQRRIEYLTSERARVLRELGGPDDGE